VLLRLLLKDAQHKRTVLGGGCTLSRLLLRSTCSGSHGTHLA
jgi:hypothetical protein